MSFAAQSIPGRVISTELRLLDHSVNRQSHSEDLHLLGALFIALQIIDGLLTYHGVSLRGTGVEGNLLIKLLMDHIGAGSALVFVKSLAVMCTMIVCVAGARIRWVRPALVSLIGLYALCAVAPWSLIILTY